MTDMTSAALSKMGRLVISAIILLIAISVSITLGSQSMHWWKPWELLFGTQHSLEVTIIQQIRLPRTVLGLIVGIAIGIAGALIQGFTHNILADPGLLGVESGAGFAVVFTSTVFGFTSIHASVLAALIGAGTASTVIIFLSTFFNSRSPLTLLLCGAIISLFLNAATGILTVLDAMSLNAMRHWQIGSIANRGWDVIGISLPFLVIGIILAIYLGPILNIMNLREDIAHSLGVRAGLSQILGVITITLLAGIATAACGPIAFIGLVVPHCARLMCGNDYRWIIIYSGIFGAALLLFSDVIGRVIARPTEIATGVITALIGAPYFIYLVHSKKSISL